MKTLAFTTRGRLVIVVNGTKPIADADWSAYVEAMRTLAQGHSVDEGRTLVFTEGATPNPAQRKLVSDLLAGRPSKTALVSISLTARAVAIAFTWFNPAFRVFDPGRVRDALEFLDVPRDRYAEVSADAHQLAKELGLPSLKSFGGKPP